MKTSFTVKAVFKATPETLYSAWLSSEQHTKMTGGEADCNDQIGLGFTAWDEYITGVNMELVPNKKIVQKWRTIEFDDNDADSDLVVEFKEVEGGTELTLHHSNIPANQPDYESGWQESYFDPMKEFFG